MEEERDSRLAVAVAVLGESYGRQITTTTIQAYEMGLAGLPIVSIERAVQRAVTERKFMPTPAELRELSGELLPQDRAIRAWDAAMKAVASDGYYRSVDFDDKCVNATIHSMGGWMRFNERLDEEEEKWLRKEFSDLYVSFLRGGISQESASYLIGYHEHENWMNGYHDAFKPPALIVTGLPALPCVVTSSLPSQPRKAISVEVEKLTQGIGRKP
jgi:hypothetical protein